MSIRLVLCILQAHLRCGSEADLEDADRRLCMTVRNVFHLLKK